MSNGNGKESVMGKAISDGQVILGALAQGLVREMLNEDSREFLTGLMEGATEEIFEDEDEIARDARLSLHGAFAQGLRCGVALQATNPTLIVTLSQKLGLLPENKSEPTVSSVGGDTDG